MAVLIVLPASPHNCHASSASGITYSTYSLVVGWNSYVKDGSWTWPAIVALPFKMSLTVLIDGICMLNLTAFAHFAKAPSSLCLRNLKPVPFSQPSNLKALLPSVALLPMETAAFVSTQALLLPSYFWTVQASAISLLDS